MSFTGIVTLYDSPNCGSKLQAFALSHTLESLGLHTCFLRTGARRPLINKGKTACKYILQGNFRKSLFYFKHIISFVRSKFKYRVTNLKTFNSADKVILGSDEIWNVARNDIAKFPVFWGRGLLPPKISYAPSINQSIEKDFVKRNCYKDMSSLDAISVRDEHSKQIISTFLNRDITIVCDPTMLVEKKDWIALETTCPEKHDFILLYCFAYQLRDDDITKIMRFSREKGLTLISVADYLPFADKNLPLNPEKFIGYIHKAKYVIASTFHGTCFSLIYQKRFAVISRNSPKVENLLSQFNASYLNITQHETIADLIDSDADEKQRSFFLTTIRNHSLAWLKANIAQEDK